MTNIFREPLFHFLLIGAALFALYGLSQDSETSDSREQIVVSAGRIQQLATVFEKTWQRPPTREELQGIVDDFVLEEAYYRQAVDMGIDRDDTIIRRRLRQKLEFLTDDAAALVAATDEQLADYLAQHPDSFREPTTYTFRQVYFNPDKHADQPEDWIELERKRLAAGDQDVGDPSLIPDSFNKASSRAVDGTFGVGFAAELDKLPLGVWQGPVPSGLGVHLVQLDDRTEGRVPELADIRMTVEREWSNDQRLAGRQAMNEQFLQNYDVVVEWPE